MYIGGLIVRQAALTRVDFRLLHGQVVTYWISTYNIKRVIIVDDELKGDKFLQDVFNMACPKGVSIEFLTCKEAGKAWSEASLDIKSENDNTMVLFKTVNSALACYEAGMKFTHLNLGNMVNGPGRINVNNSAFIGKDEARIINGLADDGVDVVLHITSGVKSSEWAPIRKKYFSDV